MKLSFKIIIMVVFVVLFSYVASIVTAYKNMTVDHKIYLNFIDSETSESITPLYIPVFVKEFFWSYFNGKNDVLNKQNEDGKPFLFLMNMINDFGAREEITIKSDNALVLAEELLCLDSGVRFIGYYKMYAVKTHNSILEKYIKRYVDGDMCKNKKQQKDRHFLEKWGLVGLSFK